MVACDTVEPEPVDMSLPPPKKVELASPDIQLLPFTTRLNKLAHVLDISVSDEMFDTLMQQRFALGDHEYARALRPDRRWSARKMGIWIKGLLPICESSRFTELYPAVSTTPDTFILNAYGRNAEPVDRMVIEDTLKTMNDDGNHDRTVCVAMLSSLEFVAQ